MAYTYSLLASTTVGSGGTSAITFSNIPQNYTDLIVKASVRSSTNAVNNLYWRINGSTTGYSERWVRGNGATATSSNAATTSFTFPIINANDDTASTFGNAEIYIPNYSNGSINKSVSMDSVEENNATTGYDFLNAGLWSNVTTVSSLSFYASSGNLAQYSSVSIYGVRSGEY